MIPEEKAKDLFNKYDKFFNNSHSISRKVFRIEKAKQCALIVADEVLYVLGDPTYFHETQSFWQKVKEEINKL